MTRGDTSCMNDKSWSHVVGFLSQSVPPTHTFEVDGESSPLYYCILTAGRPPHRCQDTQITAADRFNRSSDHTCIRIQTSLLNFHPSMATKKVKWLTPQNRNILESLSLFPQDPGGLGCLTAPEVYSLNDNVRIILRTF